MTEQPKESWNSRLGIILAVSGSAVGLGNFLRFPGQAAEYGGGAFMLAYFLSFLLLGLPICWAEWTMGRFGGMRGFHSCPAIFSLLARNTKARYLGVIGIIIPIIIYMYYVNIEAWCLGYAVNFLRGEMDFQTPAEAGSFFGAFVGAAADGSAMHLGWDKLGFYLIFVFVLNFFLIYRGVAKGIELFCTYAVPTLVVLAVIVLVRVLTLGAPDPERPSFNVNNGLGFMWNPTKQHLEQRSDWEPLAKATTTEELAELQARAEKETGLRLVPALSSEAAVVEKLTASGWVPLEEVAGLPEIRERWTYLAGLDDRRVRLLPQVTPDGFPVVQLERKLAEPRWVEAAEIVGPGLLAQVRERVADDTGWRVRKISLWEQLANLQLWLAAAGQIFFSLSVGFGVIITYASYLNKQDDVVLSGLAATSANEFCEVGLGGLISLPAGVAFLGVSGMIGMGTFAVGFNVLPMVFSVMAGGQIFGFLFFFLLFLAAVTSSLSMLQPGIAFLEEALLINRRQSVAILGFITGAGCFFVVYFSQDVKALDTLDFWVGTFLIYVLAMVQVVLFAWIFGVDRGFEEAAQGAAIRIPAIFKFILRWISPVFLVLVFLGWLLFNVLGLGGGETSGYIKDLFVEPNLVAQMSVGLILLVSSFLVLMLWGSLRFREINEKGEPQL